MTPAHPINRTHRIAFTRSLGDDEYDALRDALRIAGHEPTDDIEVLNAVDIVSPGANEGELEDIVLAVMRALDGFSASYVITRTTSP